MNGGAIAKQRYRYQDMCAMYLALKYYLEEEDIFEHIYCEQDKLDFEIWGNNYFKGYQVKDIKGTLSAKETNQIIKYYLNKSLRSGKSNRCFVFIFSKKPRHSLKHLLDKLVGNYGVQKYGKRTEKYINTALSGLVTDRIIVDYYWWEPDGIEYQVYAISSKALKNSLGNTTRDFPSDVIDNFLSRLRNEIDLISACSIESKRIYEKGNIDKLIKKFLGGVRFITLENEGTKEDVTEWPRIKLQRQREAVKSEKNVMFTNEGEEVKSI